MVSRSVRTSPRTPARRSPSKLRPCLGALTVGSSRRLRSPASVKWDCRACGRRHFYGPLPARTPEASACGSALRSPTADVPKPSADGSGRRAGSLQAAPNVA